MRFQLLGTVAAYDERGPVALGPARQRTVLAVLLVDLGSAMPMDQLVDRVWGAAAPQHAQRTLHSYLSRLRKVFATTGCVELGKRGSGYVIEVDESAVDLHRFRALAARARQLAEHGDDRPAAAAWEQALALWRGVPFADLACEWLQTKAIRLQAELRAATLDRFDVLLRCGEHQRLVPELTAASAENLLDERLAGQLMRALYRCGRQQDALAHYRLLHDRLADELGSDPGPALRELHQRILRQDPELAWDADVDAGCVTSTTVTAGAPSATAAEAPASTTPGEPAGTSAEASAGTAAGESPSACRPAQLPADVASFTGRVADLRRLDAMLDIAADEEQARAVVITAIGGTAGVGKTALAIHWGHRVADRFPDGQLYLNLRGYDPEQPVSPTDALAWMLTALGVTGQELPVDLEERAARYRSELAGRRMLIVLDNAASVAQVRPLLPGRGPCQVVVTSRGSLAGLVAVHGAHRIDLGLLSPAEAIDLLSTLIGPLVAAEPAAAAALAEQCARLPLALRVAAELVVTRPGNSLAALVAELTDRQQRLELLDAGGDPHAAVREVFSWSLQHLPADAVTVFRRLGLHPGPDLDPYPVAALAGTTPGSARRSLELLARAHLVHRTGLNRYGMHDLLRAYAAQLAIEEEEPAQRRAAQSRLADHFRAAAAAAMGTLYPADALHRPGLAPFDGALPDLTDPASAHTWLSAEQFNLTAMAAHAAAHGEAQYAVDLARILHRYLDGTNPSEALVINGHAQRAAAQAGDMVGEAHALRQLGVFYYRLARHQTAAEHLRRALDRARAAGDESGQALTLTSIGIVNYRLGNLKLALGEHLSALALARRAGDRLTEAYTLLNLGVVEERLGDFQAAVEHQRTAVALLLELGSDYGAAIALNNLANAELRLGEYEAASEHLWQSLATLREVGSPIAEAHTHDSLGILHLRRGEAAPASHHFRQAYDLYRRTGERAGQSWALNGLGEVAVLVGDYPEALRCHREALAITAEAGNRDQHARAQAGLGHAYRGQGDLDRARRQYQLAYAELSNLEMPYAAEEVQAALTAMAG